MARTVVRRDWELAYQIKSNANFVLLFFYDGGMIIHTNHAFGGEIMEFPDGKYAWMVKIGEKGQFVIPKEAREMFDLQPGNEILVLGDVKRGIAILPKAMQREYIAKIFSEMESTEQEA